MTKNSASEEENSIFNFDFENKMMNSNEYQQNFSEICIKKSTIMIRNIPNRYN